MIQFNIESCSACMACINICPKDAISVSESVESFLLPTVDINKCIHCGLCEKVCDYRKNSHFGNDIRRAFSSNTVQVGVLSRHYRILYLRKMVRLWVPSMIVSSTWFILLRKHEKKGTECGVQNMCNAIQD